MATVFFEDVFGNDVAPRVMAGIIAFSIFGNIVVMTFTASRGMTQQPHCNEPHQRALISLLLQSQTGDCQRGSATVLSLLRQQHHGESLHCKRVPLLRHQADALRLSQGKIVPLQASREPADASGAESRCSSIPALDLLHADDGGYIYYVTGHSLHSTCFSLLLRCTGPCSLLRRRWIAIPPI